MLKNYLLILFSFLFLQTHAQDVHVTLGKFSRNAAFGSKAFNLKNVKYYANLSKKAIDEVIQNQDFMNCNNAYDLSQTAIIHLESALLNDDFATAKSHLYKVEEITSEIFNEYNLCTIKNDTEFTTSENSSLSDIERQQERLKQQQIELVRQEKELRLKLEAQKNKKLELEKQNFINNNQKALTEHIRTYNTSLKACDCNSTITGEDFATSDLLAKDIDELKVFYINKTMELTQHYITLLGNCKTK